MQYTASPDQFASCANCAQNVPCSLFCSKLKTVPHMIWNPSHDMTMKLHVGDFEPHPHSSPGTRFANSRGAAGVCSAVVCSVDKNGPSFCKKTFRDTATFEAERDVLLSLQEDQHPHVLALVAYGHTFPGYGHVRMPNHLVTWPWCETSFLTFWSGESVHVCARLACIASTFAFLHAKQFVYQDVKHNNMCYHDGEFKLLDYGALTTVDAARLQEHIPHTPPYTCPDAVSSPSADVFCLGLIMATAILCDAGPVSKYGFNGWTLRVCYLHSRHACLIRIQ
jgi:hypothetical protein